MIPLGDAFGQVITDIVVFCIQLEWLHMDPDTTLGPDAIRGTENV